MGPDIDIEDYTTLDCASGKQQHYRGTKSTTKSGYTCQKWISQYPQTHGYTPEVYPNGGLGCHNYCRNPNGEPETWCYTTDPDMRWEACGIPHNDECSNAPSTSPSLTGPPTKSYEPTVIPSESPSTPGPCDETDPNIDIEDYTTLDCASGKQQHYRGTKSTTKSGYTCQKWISQYPHTHGYTPEVYPNGGLGCHNYCRNPNGGPETWCYTTDPNMRWDYCGIPRNDECSNAPSMLPSILLTIYPSVAPTPKDIASPSEATMNSASPFPTFLVTKGLPMDGPKSWTIITNDSFENGNWGNYE